MSCLDVRFPNMSPEYLFGVTGKGLPKRPVSEIKVDPSDYRVAYVAYNGFNPATNAWSLGPNMVAGRWYPSVTPLTNGEMLITEGGPDVPEVRRTDGSLRTLSTASLNLPLYPWLDVAPEEATVPVPVVGSPRRNCAHDCAGSFVAAELFCRVYAPLKK